MPRDLPFGLLTRSLPYYFLESSIREEPAYHCYEVIRDFSNLSKVVKNKGYDSIYYVDYEKSNGLTLIGRVAPCFNQVGGGVQIKLPLPVEQLLDLGMIREVKRKVIRYDKK